MRPRETIQQEEGEERFVEEEEDTKKKKKKPLLIETPLGSLSLSLVRRGKTEQWEARLSERSI